MRNGEEKMKSIQKELSDYIPAIHFFQMVKDREQVAFLDSSLVGERGNYTILGIRPYHSIWKKDGNLWINGKKSPLDFEIYFSQYLKSHKGKKRENIPLSDGAIGYFSYDYGRERMNVQTRHGGEEWNIPEAMWIFYDILVIEDCHKKTTQIICQGETGEPEDLIQHLLEEVNQLPERLKEREAVTQNKYEEVTVSANYTEKNYCKAIQQLIQLIGEGEVYIVNMTQMLEFTTEMNPGDFFMELRKRNPSSFGGYFSYGEFQIVCASPERFIHCQDGVLKTRPIKGTRKRGMNPIEDQIMREELEASKKDQSELLMIVDLERNDLNRVCIPGTVEVTKMNEVISYATVHHLESEIRGKLREDQGFMDVIRTCFPGGSITGAPKLNSMKTIDQLENGKRGIYTGSIGYIDKSGDFDLNIVIRTALCQGGKYWVGAGGGVTCESDPEFEYEETLQKAKALAEVLGIDNLREQVKR